MDYNPSALESIVNSLSGRKVPTAVYTEDGSLNPEWEKTLENTLARSKSGLLDYLEFLFDNKEDAYERYQGIITHSVVEPTKTLDDAYLLYDIYYDLKQTEDDGGGRWCRHSFSMPCFDVYSTKDFSNSMSWGIIYNSLQFYTIKIALLKKALSVRSINVKEVETVTAYNEIKRVIDFRIERWGWRRAHDVTYDSDPYSEARIDRENSNRYWNFIYTPDSLKRIKTSGLDLNKLEFRNRKAFVVDIETVDDEEIKAAAKKMKFKGDLSCTKIFRIVSGIAIKNINKIDGWGLAPGDDNQMDLKDHYIAYVNTPNHTFQAITTSIGRSLSSSNKQVTKGVFDSLDLAF